MNNVGFVLVIPRMTKTEPRTRSDCMLYLATSSIQDIYTQLSKAPIAVIIVDLGCLREPRMSHYCNREPSESKLFKWRMEPTLGVHFRVVGSFPVASMPCSGFGVLPVDCPEIGPEREILPYPTRKPEGLNPLRPLVPPLIFTLTFRLEL